MTAKFCLFSGSKNITDSLQKFGIGDEDEDLLVVLLDGDEQKESEIEKTVQGDLVDISELEQVTDLDKIAKVQKLNGFPEMKKDVNLVKSFLISRAASKEIY